MGPHKGELYSKKALHTLLATLLLFYVYIVHINTFVQQLSCANLFGTQQCKVIEMNNRKDMGLCLNVMYRIDVGIVLGMARFMRKLKLKVFKHPYYYQFWYCHPNGLYFSPNRCKWSQGKVSNSRSANLKNEAY